jgi:hypothetical protein
MDRGFENMKAQGLFSKIGSRRGMERSRRLDRIWTAKIKWGGGEAAGGKPRRRSHGRKPCRSYNSNATVDDSTNRLRGKVDKEIANSREKKTGAQGAWRRCTARGGGRRWSCKHRRCGFGEPKGKIRRGRAQRLRQSDTKLVDLLTKAMKQRTR